MEKEIATSATSFYDLMSKRGHEILIIGFDQLWREGSLIEYPADPNIIEVVLEVLILIDLVILKQIRP